MNRRNILLGTVLAFLFISIIPAQGLVKYPPEYLRLPNGIKVIAIEDNNLPMVTVGVFFNVKPYHEICENNGVAKIYRELLTSGDLKNESRYKFNERLESIGLAKDFSESQDVIYLGCTGANIKLSKALKATKELAFELNPNKEQFNLAKSKVKGFLRAQKRYPRATNLLEQKTWQRLYGTSSVEYNCPIDESLVTDLGYESIEIFKSRIIQPRNTVLVVIANERVSNIFNKVAQEFGQIKNTKSKKFTGNNNIVICPTEITSESTEYADVKDTEVVIGFEAPAFSSPQMPAAYLWQTLLNDTPNSPVKKLLQRDFPNAYNFFARYIPAKEHGLFILGYTQNSEFVDQSVYAIISELKSLKQRLPKGNKLNNLIEIARIKNLEKTESNLDRALYLGLGEVMGDYKIVESLDSELNAVEEEDFVKTHEEIFNKGKYAISVIKPNKYKNKSATDINFKILDNGIKVLTNNYPAANLAGLTMLIGTDFASQNDDAPVLAAMLATYINDEIEGLTDPKLIGARIEAQALSDCLIIEGKIRNNRLNDMAIYIKNLLLNQDLYTKANFVKTQESIIEKLNRKQRSPYNVILSKVRSKLINTDLYKLSEDKVRAIKFKNVKKLYNSWAPATNMNIVAVGNFDSNKKLQELESIFKDIPSKERDFKSNEVCSNSFEKGSVKETIKIENLQDNSVITVAFKMPPIIDSREIKDFAANSVLAHNLYESDNSILKEELSKVDPYVRIQGEVATNKTCSIMSIFITVPKDKEAEAVKVVEKTMAKIPTMEISMPQIKATKKRVVSDFIRLLEKPTQRATLIAYMIWSGMQQSIADKLLSLYSDLTPEEVNEALKKYYKNYYMLISN